MKETLRKFRKGAVNVIVSTSVVEEGIDVPSCNLVVKFDFPPCRIIQGSCKIMQGHL